MEYITEDLAYYWGDEMSKPIIPQIQKNRFLEMNLMLSAWDFRNLGSKYEKMKEQGLRNYLGLSENDTRLLIIDSGGFKGYSQNFQLSPETVLEIYEGSKLRSKDKVITLDYALLPFDSPKERQKKLAKTISNFQLMKEQNAQTTMTVHGFTQKEIATSLQVCEDESFISIPSYFTLLTNHRKVPIDSSLQSHSSAKIFMHKYFNSYSKITVQKLIAKRFLDFLSIYTRQDQRVHCLGCSASLAMHILSYTGKIHQFDSANWRVKANYYKIMLSYPDCSIAEAYIGKKKINYGSTSWNSEWDPLLLRCECPICEGLTLTERKSILSQPKSEGFNARAIHNAYHYYNELQIAKDFQGTDKYFSYIENRVKSSSGFYKMLWKVIKKYYSPSQSLRLDSFLAEECKSKRQITKIIHQEDFF